MIFQQHILQRNKKLSMELWWFTLFMITTPSGISSFVPGFAAIVTTPWYSMSQKVSRYTSGKTFESIILSFHIVELNTTHMHIWWQILFFYSIQFSLNSVISDEHRIRMAAYITFFIPEMAAKDAIWQLLFSVLA